MNGNFNDGISSKGGLVLASGNVTVNATDDGVNASGAASASTQGGMGGTVVQIADSAGNVVSAFVTTKTTAFLVFSSAAITEGEEYRVYTGGTDTVGA